MSVGAGGGAGRFPHEHKYLGSVGDYSPPTPDPIQQERERAEAAKNTYGTPEYFREQTRQIYARDYMLNKFREAAENGRTNIELT